LAIAAVGVQVPLRVHLFLHIELLFCGKPLFYGLYGVFLIQKLISSQNEI
jgi:hypothetical protein